MTEPSARVVCDSYYRLGPRLTTFEVTMHRLVLAEFNTHRLFSRNSASSRAIPVAKQIEKVVSDPALPLEWGRNQKGMQAGELLSGAEAAGCRNVWLEARDAAVEAAQELAERGVHKQVVNRLLEPFMWHTAIVTSTEWFNFFDQRCSPLAQPEIRAVANAMRAAMNANHPQLISTDDWHLPYIQLDECFIPSEARKISAARCARVSYLTQNGVRDPEEDLKLFYRLVEASPGHWSPLEHVAAPDPRNRGPGNLHGWLQLRHIYQGAYLPDDHYRRTVTVHTDLV